MICCLAYLWLTHFVSAIDAIHTFAIHKAPHKHRLHFPSVHTQLSVTGIPRAHDHNHTTQYAPWFGETQLQRVPALSYIYVQLGHPPQKFRVQVCAQSRARGVIFAVLCS